ncbi:Short-chain dehydrogenase [Pasteurella testudinis DSM 23072]|uniref:Short-chain dehydrogenase n=1 Tax=Pasteurella testudinis DSM 23072 TaxID=1122938 RepID=A0A1W1V6I7_9PAST|nr:SDR family NAD(P)-dependent oxidoreductase [Pasteurella testudinis]SMB88998.1 Short-chain dehydrogenase [Pasteurella testudinis DSM 23072]SUB50232.1 putative NADP-dependent dehydrogenase [Pasteurella testudinis]
MEHKKMKRKLAMVTGGSAGIGLEIARLLAQDQYDLLLVGASSRVFEAAESLAQYGTQVSALQADLSTEAGNQALLDAVKHSGRPLDVAVLNAGIAIGGAFIDNPLDRHLQLLALNITSPVRLTYGLLPDMIAQGGGKFLFVSSLSATTPTPYESVYGPSKAFLTSFANSIREELKEQGIQITTLHPGATATEFHARAGMQTTAFGDNSWKNSPELVAKQGYEALQAGKTNVVGGDETTQQAWVANRSMDEEEKARIHAERAMPNSPLQRGV